MASAAVGLPLVLLAVLAPGPLILPLFGMLSLGFAAVCAFVSRSLAETRDAEHLTWWDAAGALAFIGFAAVLLSKPEDVLPLLGHQ